MKTTCITFCCSLLATLAISAPAPADLDVLIVTGVDYPGHHWWETTPVLAEELTREKGVRVQVLKDPYQLGQTPLKDYEVLVLHFMNWEKPAPDGSARENLRSFVANGGGLVGLHFACGAFSNWTEYPNLLGRIWDGVNTHDPRGPFRVDVTDRPHPVMQGLGESFATDDELYIGLTGDKPVTILATARSKVTGRDHPMALAHEYGRGRVFFTPLGHDVQALRTAGTARMIRQAVVWAGQGGPTPAGTAPAGANPSATTR